MFCYLHLTNAYRKHAIINEEYEYDIHLPILNQCMPKTFEIIRSCLFFDILSIHKAIKNPIKTLNNKDLIYNFHLVPKHESPNGGSTASEVAVAVAAVGVMVSASTCVQLCQRSQITFSFIWPYGQFLPKRPEERKEDMEQVITG